MVARKEKRERIPSTRVEESNIVGMPNDGSCKEKAVKWRNGEMSGGHRGDGDLRKTTFAKKIYEDSDVQHHFDRRAWVFVSQ